MDQSITHACALSFYKELYQLNENQSIVINEVTSQLALRKHLTDYSINVYEQLKKLHHTHIVGILDYVEVDNGIDVYEEYISGSTLQEALETNMLSNEDKHRIYLEILHAVETLHSLQEPIIHRDIKTNNIMLTTNKHAILIDFNASKITDITKEKDTVLLGTAGKAAPEQYGFMQSDERTDVYALGILLQDIFPDSYKKIVHKATRMDPIDRYQTVKQLEASLPKPFSKIQEVEVRYLDVKHNLHVFMNIIFALLPFIMTDPKSDNAWRTVWIEYLGIWLMYDYFGSLTHFFYDHHICKKSKNPKIKRIGYIITGILLGLFWIILAGQYIL